MADEPDILIDDDRITAVGMVGVHWTEDDPETIFLNSRYGNIRLGGDGQDGDLFLDDQGGDTRIHLDSGHGPVDRDEVRVYLDGQHGNIRLGGDGQDGDLLMEDQGGDTRIHLDPGHGPVDREEVRVYLDGEGAEAVLGDAGASGAVRVKDDDGTETGTLSEGSLALGASGRAGRLVLESGGGTRSMRLDGEEGTATLGGIGGSGDVVVRETVTSRIEVPAGDDEPAKRFRVLVTDAGTVEPESTRLSVDDDFELVLLSEDPPVDLQLAVQGPASQPVTLPESQVTVDGAKALSVTVADVAVATPGTLDVVTASGASASVRLEVQPDAPVGDPVGPEVPVPVPRVHLDGDASGPASPAIRGHLAGDGTLTLGGDGEGGTVRLRDSDGTDVGEVDVESGQVRVSDGSGGPALLWDPSNGDLTVRDAAGNDALAFDAATGDLDVAGSLNENA